MLYFLPDKPQLRRTYYRLYILKAISGGSSLNYIQLALYGWISQLKAHHKSVELGIRKKLCSGTADRVLRGNYYKWIRNLICHSIHSHMSLLHNLEKCRLCLWRCSVYLICEEQIAHNSTRSVHKLICRLIVHRKSRYISRKDIRCKLDSLVLEPHCICKCKSHRRLADSRYIVHENVTACDYRRHYLGNTHILAYDDLLHLIYNVHYLVIIIHLVLPSFRLSVYIRNREEALPLPPCYHCC